VLELAVVGFDAVVGVLLDVVPGRGDKLVEGGGVDRCGVGDHLARRHLQHRKCPAKELSGRVGVAAGRDEYVDDLPMLVDRSVDVRTGPDPDGGVKPAGFSSAGGRWVSDTGD
jgi:hypothetical protein